MVSPIYIEGSQKILELEQAFEPIEEVKDETDKRNSGLQNKMARTDQLFALVGLAAHQESFVDRLQLGQRTQRVVQDA